MYCFCVLLVSKATFSVYIYFIQRIFDTQFVFKNLMQWKKTESWVPVTHTCNPSLSRGRDQEDQSYKLIWAKSETLSQKYPTQKRAGRVAQVLKCLHSKCEAWVQPQYWKKRKKAEAFSLSPIAEMLCHVIIFLLVNDYTPSVI
jgi:hypothetical protein